MNPSISAIIKWKYLHETLVIFLFQSFIDLTILHAGNRNKGQGNDDGLACSDEFGIPYTHSFDRHTT